MEDMREIIEDFLIEAFELIDQIDQDLVELENNPEDLELLNSIFRVAHTIKGSSSFLNFDVLTKLTHHMEDVLNKARRDELKMTPEVMDVVLESIDYMKALLQEIRDTGSDQNSSIDIDEICKKLDAISNGKEIEEYESEYKEEKEKQNENKEENSEEEIDYSNMSKEEIEAEIEKLLKKRKEEDKKRRELKKAQKKLEDKNKKEEKKRASQTKKGGTKT